MSNLNHGFPECLRHYNAFTAENEPINYGQFVENVRYYSLKSASLWSILFSSTNLIKNYFCNSLSFPVDTIISSLLIAFGISFSVTKFT